MRIEGGEDRDGWINGWMEAEEGGGVHSFFFVMIWEAACHFMEIKLRQTQLRAVGESSVRPDRPEQGPTNWKKAEAIITINTFFI